MREGAHGRHRVVLDEGWRLEPGIFIIRDFNLGWRSLKISATLRRASPPSNPGRLSQLLMSSKCSHPSLPSTPQIHVGPQQHPLSPELQGCHNGCPEATNCHACTILIRASRRVTNCPKRPDSKTSQLHELPPTKEKVRQSPSL